MQYKIAKTDKRRGTSRRKFPSLWGNEDTQKLIDILEQYQVKATFFVVGDWVDRYPESVKALHDAGHEVMNHSNSHAHMNQLSREEIVADVEACNDKIEAVTGVRPTLIRPPYGEYNNTVISTIRSIDMEPIQWDVDVSQTGSRNWGRTGEDLYWKRATMERQGDLRIEGGKLHFLRF